MQNYPIMFLTVLVSVLVYEGSNNPWYTAVAFFSGLMIATAVNQIIGWLHHNGNTAYTGIMMQLQDIEKQLPPKE